MGFFNYLMKNLGLSNLDETLAKGENLAKNNKTEILQKKDNNFIYQDTLAVVSPKVFQEVVDLVEYISAGHTVVVDFGKLNDANIDRSVDFLSGAIFALGGNMQIVSNGLYLYMPKGIRLVNPSKRKKK